MGNSFGDQFLKAGLVDKARLEKSKKSKRKQQKLKQKQKVEVVDEAAEAAEAARKAAAEAAERDRELNRQKKEAAERRAIQAQIRQLVELNRLTDAEGDVAYNFQDGAAIKTLHVTETTRDKLARGQLAIVRFDAAYEVIPIRVADKIEQRDASSIVSRAENRPEAGEDDFYADYKVPDDLMW